MQPVVVLVTASDETAPVSGEIQELGYAVQRATSIREASASVRDPEVVAIITELALPDGNWRDLVERMKAGRAAVPLMLISAASTAELWWDALENGVSDILVAPVGIAELKRVLMLQRSTIE